MPRVKTILISACEQSADRYAAAIVLALQQHDPTVNIIGIGSDALKKTGIDVRFDVSKYATVGLIEPLRYLPHLIMAYFKIRALLKKEQPDVFIPIDNQGLHLACCRVAKRWGIRVLYYIAPQHWHWGTHKQGQAVAQCVDRILAIFPQEATFYRQCGASVSFVGHPCTDRILPYRKQRQAGPYLAVFPGSRTQEIERMLPLFLAVIEPWCRQYHLTPIISVASQSFEPLIRRLIATHAPGFIGELHTTDSLALIAKARLSLLTSGTVSLEHALLGVPHVVAYRFNPVTYWIARTFFAKTLAKIPFMSMPNMLLGKEVFTELLQERATVEYITAALTQCYCDKERYHMQQSQAARVWDSLYAGSSPDQVAAAILTSA